MAGEEFFCPKAVDDYHGYLERAVPTAYPLKNKRAYVRNMAYALQYLEYLDDLLKHRPLHSVVRNHTHKSVVVTGCSFMECLLWMLLKGNGYQAKEEWEGDPERVGNEFVENGRTVRYVITRQLKAAAPMDVEMRFIEMCKRAERKKVLGSSPKVYEKLNYLRQLRNRVHIHLVKHDRDTDWWQFKSRDADTMKLVDREHTSVGDLRSLYELRQHFRLAPAATTATAGGRALC